MTKRIICIDFDGVLHSYTSGWKGPRNIPDPPVTGALDWLNALWESDQFQIMIYSSRSRYPFGRWAMKRWLHKHLLDHFGGMMGPKTWDPLYLEILEGIKWPLMKPPAFVTIDDRALRFQGKWIPPEELITFRPWKPE